MPRTALASITPGLEDALLGELTDLGLAARRVDGGVEFLADPASVYAVNLHSRLAARVTVRLGRGSARNLDALAQLVRSLPWRDFVRPGQPVEVRFSSSGSRLRHREPAQRKVALAIADALRGPRLPGPRPPRESLQVVVRVVGDRATVSVDSSGELLHRRGWRRATAKAPLRENLAAAILHLAGWVPGQPLVDPMCGSGTFAVEAAPVAIGKAPGARRSFAFEHWPTHDARLWRRLQGEARLLPVLDAGAPIVAADRDAGAVAAARSNADRAGVGGRVQVVERALQEHAPPAGPVGLLVVNPPYGRRVRGGQRTFPLLGRALREDWAGWGGAVLLPDPRFKSALGADFEERAKFKNGGVPVWLFVREPKR